MVTFVNATGLIRNHFDFYEYLYVSTVRYRRDTMGSSYSTTHNAKARTENDGSKRRGQPPNLGGKWYNELGSEMELTVAQDGIITGDYYTAVESKPGAKGKQPVHIVGHASPDGSHDTFGFNVLWKKGASTTSWAGEYKEYDGEPVLLTTWLLTSETDSYLDNWMSTRTGNNCFTRFRQRPRDGIDLTDEDKRRRNPCAAGGSWDYRNKHSQHVR